MTDLFWLTDVHMERLKQFFPLSLGVPRIDDKRALSGFIFINYNELRRLNIALYNRWSRLGVFARILTELAVEGRDTDVIMIDATHLKAYRTTSSLRGTKQLIGRTKGGLNNKLHAFCDTKGRPFADVPQRGPNKRSLRDAGALGCACPRTRSAA